MYNTDPFLPIELLAQRKYTVSTTFPKVKFNSGLKQINFKKYTLKQKSA